MSYCRNDGRASDVYVIGTRYGLECCGCTRGWPNYSGLTHQAMLWHLEQHVKVGDRVPKDAIARLKREMAARAIGVSE